MQSGNAVDKIDCERERERERESRDIHKYLNVRDTRPVRHFNDEVSSRRGATISFPPLIRAFA
jgi:hypothetical protein